MYRDHQQAAALRAHLVDSGGLRQEIDVRLGCARRVNAMVWARWAAGCGGLAAAVVVFVGAFLPRALIDDSTLALLVVGGSVAPFAVGVLAWLVGLGLRPPRPPRLDPADTLTELCRRESRADATFACQRVSARVEPSCRVLLAGYIALAPLASHMLLWLGLIAISPSAEVMWLSKLASLGDYVRLAAHGTVLGHIAAVLLAWRAAPQLSARRSAPTLAILHALTAAAVVGVNTMIAVQLHYHGPGLAAMVVGALISGIATVVTGFTVLWIAYALNLAWMCDERALLAAAGTPPTAALEAARGRGDVSPRGD